MPTCAREKDKVPMKINLAESAGFCFGVRRALEIALKTSSSEKRVYMLGDIVHNEDVVRQIKEVGIKKTGRLSRGKNKTLLIRAHGASLETIIKAQSLGYKVIDATCPMVKEIHRIARGMEEKGYTIIVIGDKKHDEVQGIVGQLKNKALVIDGGTERLRPGIIKNIRKACVVVQSTQNLDRVLKIFDTLKNYIPELKLYNTVCKPTRKKQEEIKKLPLENDVMIIIGSRQSANSRRLYEISKSLNNNSYWVNSKEEIKPLWLKGAESVGVAAGASTPNSTIKDIVDFLSRLRLKNSP